jgi:hypothetical protein
MTKKKTKKKASQLDSNPGRAQARAPMGASARCIRAGIPSFPGVPRVGPGAYNNILVINRANGFGEMRAGDWDGENKWFIPGVLALIESEVSEALEEFRSRGISHLMQEKFRN